MPASRDDARKVTAEQAMWRAAMERAAEICDAIWEQDAGTEGAGSSAACATAIRAEAGKLPAAPSPEPSARAVAEHFVKLVERKRQALADDPENGHVEGDTNAFIWTNSEAEWQSILLDELAEEVRAFAASLPAQAEGGKVLEYERRACREAFDKAGYWPNEVMWKAWQQAWSAAIGYERDLSRRAYKEPSIAAAPTKEAT